MSNILLPYSNMYFPKKNWEGMLIFFEFNVYLHPDVDPKLRGNTKAIFTKMENPDWVKITMSFAFISTSYWVIEENIYSEIST